ncbi:unnamed protein product [Dovyalis caffra]|uniref:RNA methyltransferase At5g10620 n=1 Tax=Dovyalis caffra TaxID=77055 RepID=A0AAV1SQK6_9ROSI|nr:unnamed protein product [Dovyalis caffra]
MARISACPATNCHTPALSGEGRRCKYTSQSVVNYSIPIFPSGDEKAQVNDEDNAVMNLIRSDDWVVMLDERGRDIGSEQMAELIGDAGNTGASRLSFCIGGPYGHGKQMRKRANASIRLSSMVLNHQIALLVLVEQLYR